jgi:hypothetical protein
VKQAVRQVKRVDDRDLVQRCLNAVGPAEVRAILGRLTAGNTTEG